MLHVINVVVSKLAACSGRIHCTYVVPIVSHSQNLFFLLCWGGERKGSGEHSIASSLAYPEIDCAASGLFVGANDVLC